MDPDIAIKVDHVGKSFKLPHERSMSVKNALINITRRRRGYEDFRVLNDISFEIKKGEFFGIVGRNGSGKSTLLKILAGIYTPSKGDVHINGKLVPFIELGVGFNPELTGRENVYLNGALLGFNRKEMNAMYGDVVAFAELEKFMDQKLKNYSSGMQVRLAFSVAIRANTDILLIDEVLAVGDQSFQEKCFSYFAELKNSSKTIVFVTHDMSNVERFCDKVFVMDKKSNINGTYTVPEAVTIYNKLNHEMLEKIVSSTKRQVPAADVYIKKVTLRDELNNPASTISSNKPMTIEVQLGRRSNGPGLPLVVGLAFHNKEGINLAGPNSAHAKFTSDTDVISYHLDHLPFNMGEYYLTVALFDDKLTRQYDVIDKGITFFVNTERVYHGQYILDGDWE